MKLRHINMEGAHGRQIVRPFRPDCCRIQFWQYRHADDHPGRKHDEKIVVTAELTPGEVVCAIQKLRRWLKDRVRDAEEDMRRGGLYYDGPEGAAYSSREDDSP